MTMLDETWAKELRAALTNVEKLFHEIENARSDSRQRPGHYQISFAETCSCREVVEVLVTTPAELDGGAVADE
jgi:hypothetical protein